MASITIRRLEDSTKQKLRVRASRNGRSMEEEARQILKGAVALLYTNVISEVIKPHPPVAVTGRLGG
jgi:plasmid stability protein